jgi:hypothetical protein
MPRTLPRLASPARLRLVAGVAAALALAAVTPGWATGSPAKARFGQPLQVTPPNSGGYEPGIYADRSGGLYMTAHKENAQLALAPDNRSTTQTRSMSWAWYSRDGGKSWLDLPLGPADIQNHEFGDEGDMAVDDASNLYFVDTEVADVTFTAWHLANGQPTFTYNTPALGSTEAFDDRPWIAAHLNGHVFYFGNESDKVTNPSASTTAGPGSGAGRYTVFKSSDGGQSWDHTGIQLKGSGWCRPAAAPKSAYVYALCTDDAGADDVTTTSGDKTHRVGTIYSYVSADDGKTWNRYPVTHYNAFDAWTSYPVINVAADGSLWGFYVDGKTKPTCTSGQCTPMGAKFPVMHSVDHGKHWRVYDAAPAGAAKDWQYRYGWVSVNRDSKTLGLAVYGRPYTAKSSNPWRVYGAVFRAGQHPALTSLDEKHPVAPAFYDSPPGDFLMTVFDGRGKLHVAWTRGTLYADSPVVSAQVTRDIFTATQL